MKQAKVGDVILYKKGGYYGKVTGIINGNVIIADTKKEWNVPVTLMNRFLNEDKSLSIGTKADSLDKARAAVSQAID